MRYERAKYAVQSEKISITGVSAYVTGSATADIAKIGCAPCSVKE